MVKEHWQEVYEAHGQIEAEMVRGLLEAQGMTVFLSQEGAAHAFALTVGTMGVVQVLVPDSQLEKALEIIHGYETAVETEEPSVEYREAEKDDEDAV